MKIDCIADLHGFYPKLDGGDLLIVAGDLTDNDTIIEHDTFDYWLSSQSYKKKIFISGNHDNSWQKKEKPRKFNSYYGSRTEEKFEYLCDSGTEFEGLKIWGTPWTAWFDGINPKCKAFTKKNDKELDKKWALIPQDTDILITHSPPYGIFDSIHLRDGSVFPTGSITLRNRILCKEMMPHLKLHVFGHIHEHGGKVVDLTGLKCVNASIMNEVFDPIHKSVRIEL